MVAAPEQSLSSWDRMVKDEKSRPHELDPPTPGAPPVAPDAAIQEVYRRLQAAARRHLRTVRTPHTLEPAELVSEAWLRLQRAPEQSMDREVFVAIASTTMRHVLIDYEKHRSRVKRGGPDKDLELKPDLLGERPARITVIGLHRALARLEGNDPNLAKLIELRFFGGLTIDQAAHELGYSPRTAAREWTVAKAWLRRELG